MNRSVRGLLWAGAAVAIPATINTLIAARVSRLEPALPGDIGYYDWVHGRVAFYRLGEGPPLLLVHNPNAGGSSWEWRKVFPELATHFTTYAIDLLGFGLSDKPAIPYSGRMMGELVHDFLEDVVERPADAIGSALGASYLVNAAVRRPEGLRRLVVVNPTGTTSTASPLAEGAVYTTLRAPVLGTSLYNSLVSQRNIERELQLHAFYDPAMATPGLVRYLYVSAHQPGSQYAAAAFISGHLDLPLRMDFAALTQPVLIIWGRDAYYTPIGDAADLLFRHPEARLEILDECGMLPHDEKAGEFLRLTRDFLTESGLGEMAA